MAAGASNAVLAAQEPASQSQGASTPAPTPAATFRGGVDLVSLTVTVTDRRRQLVRNLTAHDFAVMEDGVQQTVSFFGSEDVPLDVVIMMDCSASMDEKLPVVQRAAIGLVDSLGPNDRAELIEFRSAVTVREPMTRDRQAIMRGIKALRANGDTSLYTSLYLTLRDFAGVTQREVRRKAVVLLSDGQDTRSLVSFDDVLDLARRSGVSVYTVALNSAIDRIVDGRKVDEGSYSLKTLAEATGARAFFPAGIGDVRAIYVDIAAELGAQYALGYIPRHPIGDGSWRQVSVNLTDRPGARARARQGYFAWPSYGALTGLLHQ